MKTSRILLVLILVLSINPSHSQSEPQNNSGKKFFIGSSLFMAFTPFFDPSPKFYQLNLGYRITPKDVVSIEAITWTYQGPLGRPYGPDYEEERSNFPGSIQALGIGLAYKRFLWKGLHVGLQSVPFKQNYLDLDGNKIQSGFQLFNTWRIGYQIQLFENRLFIEPAVAFTSWPINTNLPESFQVEEDKWPKYFLFEPGFHFGFNF